MFKSDILLYLSLSLKETLALSSYFKDHYLDYGNDKLM